MSASDLAVAVGAGVIGFGIIWGLFNLVRQQKAPPVELLKSDSESRSEGDGKLSLAQLGRSWHTVLGVSEAASTSEIESAYHARLAECDGISFSSDAGTAEKQDAEVRRVQVSDAYEFIRSVKQAPSPSNRT
jgi:hypothetical protein